MKNVLIMAGGTGGHIFPALAVADLLQKKGASVEWLGTEKGLESRLVPEHNYPINMIDIGGLRGKGIITLLLLPFKLIKAVMQTLKVYQRIKPDVVLGMGGFVTGPGGLVAWLLGKPLLIHEQNAIAGLTNKILYRLSKKVFSAFPGAFSETCNKEKLSVIGNPVRKEIINIIDPQAYYDDKWFQTDQPGIENNSRNELNILIVGGSLGAVALNETVPQALKLINDNGLLSSSHSDSKQNDFSAINVCHQCGEKNLDRTLENYHVLKQQSDSGTGQFDSKIDVQIMAFISDMAASYQWADLVICRSGALTISEIAAAGVASLLVPFPYAVDDHQTANAQYLANEGAAYLVQQKDLSKEKLAEIINSLDKKTILDMACKARELSINNAAEVVAEQCLQLAG